MRVKTLWEPTVATKAANAPATVHAPITTGARERLDAMHPRLAMMHATMTSRKTPRVPTSATLAASAQVPEHAPLTAGARALPVVM